jgi:phosphinothricin acetyltransferase
MKALDVHLAQGASRRHGARMIRDATLEDSAAVHAIYVHHVLHGTASYDVEPPPLDRIRDKMRWILGEEWPFLVADEQGQPIAYAYATQFRDRAAYRFTCENSIYVHPDWIGRGVGKALLQALIERSGAYGFRTMIAVIGGAEPASVGLHVACGFREVGRLKAVGWKKERWLDSVYMQRELVAEAT